MRLRFDQLGEHLKRGLAPIYLICGDEPWQLGEAARRFVPTPRGQGFEREVLDQEANLRLVRFGRRRGRPVPVCQSPAHRAAPGSSSLGQEGGAAVRRYCERTNPDTCLLMVASQLERKDLKTKWAQEVERVGACSRSGLWRAGVWSLARGAVGDGRFSARAWGCGPAGGAGRG